MAYFLGTIGPVQKCIRPDVIPDVILCRAVLFTPVPLETVGDFIRHGFR